MMTNNVFYFEKTSNIPEIDIRAFVQKSMMARTVHVINQRIVNIAENIGWVLFKLGSSNLCQVRHKIIPSMLLPRQPFLLLGLFN